MRTAMIALLALAALSQSAQAQLDPQMATILAVRDAAGWRIDVEVEGLGLTSVAFTPPGQPALDVPCESGSGVILCERVEPPPPSAGAATLAALLVQFPAGSWSLSVNGGALTAALPFDPQEPDGVVTVTDPANGATQVSSTPTVSYQNGCALCTFLEFQIEDLATLGEVFEIGALVFGAAPLPSGQLDFADFTTENTPGPLPVGDYRMMAAAGIGALETRAFDQGPEFQFGSGASLQSHTLFSVPEADGAAIAAAAALLVLTGCRRGARRARGVPRALRRPARVRR
jgi:hypothetical protein